MLDLIKEISQNNIIGVFGCYAACWLLQQVFKDKMTTDFLEDLEGCLIGWLFIVGEIHLITLTIEWWNTHTGMMIVLGAIIAVPLHLYFITFGLLGGIHRVLCSKLACVVAQFSMIVINYEWLIPLLKSLVN